MTAALALARAELRMLARNRVASITAVLVPLAGGLWIVTDAPARTPLGSAGAIATVQLLAITALAVASTGATTLVARRQQQVLERWRTSPAPTAAVLAGTLAPAGALLAVQATILFAATARAAGAAPAHPTLLVAAAVLAGALGAATAVLTAGLTRTVEAAGITVLPAMVALIGGGTWVASTPAGEVTWPMRATGGGALAELVQIAWHGPDGTGAPTDAGSVADALGAAWPAVATLLVVTTVLGVAAHRNFRWRARP